MWNGPLADDTVAYGHDVLGRTVSRTFDGVTATRAFDALGRVATQVDPIGTVTLGRAQSLRSLILRTLVQETRSDPNRPFRLDAASADIEEANRLWTNSEVSKLGGIVAFRRQELDLAIRRFEAAGKLNPEDCETTYYLGLVRADQRQWEPAAGAFTSAASCLDAARRRLQGELDGIRRSTPAGDRQMRQIVRREQDIAAAARMLATSWFNTAVAYVNLGRIDEARRLAERVADDERLGGRARALLKRLDSRAR